jgi:hypothetical protein
MGRPLHELRAIERGRVRIVKCHLDAEAVGVSNLGEREI